MAEVSAKNGVIILDEGDSYTGVGSHLIHAINVRDITGAASGNLTDSDGAVIFAYQPNGLETSFTSWFPIRGCVSTGNGLISNVVDSTIYIYIR